MKEWKPEEAVDMIYDLLMDNITEEALSDAECKRIAQLIVKSLNDPT
jgi:hypothetical protein